MIPNKEDAFISQQNLRTKKRIKIILLISVPIIIIIVSVVLIVKFANRESKDDNSRIQEIRIAYNLSTFFFFDPISNTPCTEKNYWTPFDKDTSCYRWISITCPDTNISKIKLLLLTIKMF